MAYDGLMWQDFTKSIIPQEPKLEPEDMKLYREIYKRHYGFFPENSVLIQHRVKSQHGVKSQQRRNAKPRRNKTNCHISAVSQSISKE
jgi:hypothetical protein